MAVSHPLKRGENGPEQLFQVVLMQRLSVLPLGGGVIGHKTQQQNTTSQATRLNFTLCSRLRPRRKISFDGIKPEKKKKAGEAPLGHASGGWAAPTPLLTFTRPAPECTPPPLPPNLLYVYLQGLLWLQ